VDHPPEHVNEKRGKCVSRPGATRQQLGINNKGINITQRLTSKKKNEILFQCDVWGSNNSEELTTFREEALDEDSGQFPNSRMCDSDATELGKQAFSVWTQIFILR